MDTLRYVVVNITGHTVTENENVLQNVGNSIGWSSCATLESARQKHLVIAVICKEEAHGDQWNQQGRSSFTSLESAMKNLMDIAGIYKGEVHGHL